MTQDPTRPVGAPASDELLRVLESVCDQSPTGLLVFDSDLRYVLVNPRMAAMANTPADQLLGRSFRDAFPEFGELTAIFEQVLASGQPLVGMDVSGSAPGEDGSGHVWSMSAYRLTADDGAVLGLAVTSTDVTAARALERERVILARRLELLADSGELLSGGLDQQSTLDGVLRLVVPALAQWACVHLVNEDDGRIRLAALRHADPAAQPLLAQVLSAFEVTTDQVLGAGHVIATGTSQDLPDVTEDMLATLAGGDAQTLVGLLALEISHGVVVPLAAAGTTFGALSVSLEPPAGHGDDVVGAAEALIAQQELLRDVAARAALALDNARLYQRQHRVAVTLQRSLLPRSLPQPSGLDIAAQYLPGAAGTEVGGDFYEAVLRSDGRLVLAIGDVMGRGVRAAAVMGQVRAALRGYALEGHGPGGILRRLNAIVTTLGTSAIVTCLPVLLDLDTGDLEMACAGHVPPLFAAPDGSCSLLPLEPDPPLGVLGTAYGSTRAHLALGSTLVLFTDGLVEGRDQPVADGMNSLCEVITAALPSGWDGTVTADQVCTAAIDGMGRSEGAIDDVAVLVVRRAAAAGA
ncbi:MAG: hypothetical protein QOH75_1085 [Actinomycetota bacterium]|nr:hypothetical protein [Actinomycetota bacterium]